MAYERPLKWYKKLNEASFRSSEGFFLAEGANTVRQIAQISPQSIEEILYDEVLPAELLAFNARKLAFGRLNDILSSKTPQGVAAVVKLPSDIYSQKLPDDLGNKVLLLDDVSDPGNTGTLIRTAAAFGFSGVVLTKNGADAFSPKVVSSSAGALFSLWIRRVDSAVQALEYLQKHGFYAISTSLEGGEDTTKLRQNKLLLIMGSEARGVQPQLLKKSDYSLCLPMDNSKIESLNVAVSGGICMYLTNRQ